MSTKHIFESPQGLVLKSLRGAVALNPSLGLHAPSKSIYIFPQYRNKDAQVAVISGGGAGHEPAHSGYTGNGMLTSSVSGDIFASPSAKQILAAIELAVLSAEKNEQARVNEVLVVINNYTGDRLNFGLAIEKARALIPGLQIDSVIVSEDVSLLHSPTPSLIGARGIGGNILVCKLLGALSSRGASLQQVKILGDTAVKNFASIGVGLDHCHVPGRNNEKHEGALDDGECEIGLGLHNEPGARRVKIEGGAEAIVRDMLDEILTSREGGFVKFEKEDVDDVILFVNNLGGMSQLEMGAVVDEALSQLEAINIRPIRIYSSTYMTSLNAPGFSLSLLNVSSVYRDLAHHEQGSIGSGIDWNIDIIQLLDDPTDATAWLGVRSNWPVQYRSRAPQRKIVNREVQAKSSERLVKSMGTDGAEARDDEDGGEWYRRADVSPVLVQEALEKACETVLAAEAEMTKFDTVVGDGDCGETFAAGAKAVSEAIKTGRLDVAKLPPWVLVRRLGEILEDNMGGTIGALFALYFTSLSTSLLPTSSDPSPSWSGAPKAALLSLSTYTPARPGDRTIVDALLPFCDTLASTGGSLGDAAKAAKKGAESTRGMKARLGRAVYVNGAGEDDSELPPDPGAWGVSAIVEGLVRGFNGA